MLNSSVRDGVGDVGAVHAPPVSFQISQVSIVPNSSSPASARCCAPGTWSSSQRILVPEKYASISRPGALAKQRLEAVGFEALADVGADAALPDDRGVDRSPGRALPDDGRLALVGDADGGDVAAATAARSPAPRGRRRPWSRRSRRGRARPSPARDSAGRSRGRRCARTRRRRRRPARPSRSCPGPAPARRVAVMRRGGAAETAHRLDLAPVGLDLARAFGGIPAEQAGRRASATRVEAIERLARLEPERRAAQQHVAERQRPLVVDRARRAGRRMVG